MLRRQRQTATLNSYLFLQKRVGLTFFADGGRWPVSGYHLRIVRQLKQLVVQRTHDFVEGPAGQVRAADTPSEQGISGNECLLFRKIKTDAAFRVSWRVDHG